jgi:hypothetical protein
LCFTFQLAGYFLKRNEFYNSAQLIQVLFVPVSYNGVLMYAMYVAKLNFEDWVLDINYVRVWLFIEISFFFIWILSGAIFVFVAYLIKLKPTLKSEAVLALDDNVWNDKCSDDFLRFIKFDFYIFTFILAMLIMEIYVGLIMTDQMGVASNGYPVKPMFILIIIHRSGQILHNVVKMRNGNRKFTDSFINEDSGKQLDIIHFCVDICIMTAVTWMFFQNDQLKSSNMMAKVWVHAELICFLMTVPYQLLIANQLG